MVKTTGKQKNRESSEDAAQVVKRQQVTITQIIAIQITLQNPQAHRDSLLFYTKRYADGKYDYERYITP